MAGGGGSGGGAAGAAPLPHAATVSPIAAMTTAKRCVNMKALLLTFVPGIRT